MDMTVERVKETVHEHRRLMTGVGVLVLVIGILVITAPANEDPGTYPAGAVEETVAPIGQEGAYRIGEYEDGLLYGPYLVESDAGHPILGPILGLVGMEGDAESGIGAVVGDLQGETSRAFFYHEGQVLDSSLNPVDRPEVAELHQFYLETYLDPLLYAPTNGVTPSSLASGEGHLLSGSGADTNERVLFGDFERFEEHKILAEVCDMDYDLIPQQLFDHLDRTKQVTEYFLLNPSPSSKQRLIEEQRSTVDAYTGYLSDFLDVMNTNVSENDCFPDEAERFTIARATLTEPSYRINSTTLMNYVRMANSNAERLLEEINQRAVGNSTDVLPADPEEPGIETITHRNYSDLLTPEEALDTFNEQRRDEYVNIRQGERGTAPNRTLTPEEQREAGYVGRVPRRYDITTYCTPENEKQPVYGWRDDVYPNVVTGLRSQLSTESDVLDHYSFFSVCRCPYREISRLNWHANDRMYTQVENAPLGPNTSEAVEQAEQIFLQAPGDSSYDQLGRVYLHSVEASLARGQLVETLPELWRRGQQARSKLHVLNDTYDDFYNDQHMDVWRDYFNYSENVTGELAAREFNYYLIMESLYPLTFMTWSDQVWRLDEVPQKLAGIRGEDGPPLALP